MRRRTIRTPIQHPCPLPTLRMQHLSQSRRVQWQRQPWRAGRYIKDQEGQGTHQVCTLLFIIFAWHATKSYGIGNTTPSKTAANQMRRHAHQSEVSARIVVQCCGCGIITGPNWFILLRRRLILSCQSRMRWFVLWIRLSRLMYGGQKGRRRFTSCTVMRVWRGGTRSIIFTMSEELNVNVYIVCI